MPVDTGSVSGATLFLAGMFVLVVIIGAIIYFTLALEDRRIERLRSERRALVEGKKSE